MTEPVPGAIGAILYPSGQAPEALMVEFAAELARQGWRVGGLLQITSGGGEGERCRMEVVELDSGRRLSITQELGPGSQSCALDPAALAEASGAVRRAVAAGADLVLINKFSKAEKAGHGLAAEMLAVMAEGIPLLTAVPDEALVEWTGFTGGGATLLAPDIQALRRWWAGAAERRDAAGHP